MPPSQAPFRPFSLFLVRSVLRNTHATSTLERARALHPLHRDVLSKIQPFFSRADQWALPLPLYPASAYIRRPFRHSRPGFEISFVSLYVSSMYANNLFGYHFRYTRADVPLERENLVLSLLRVRPSLPWLSSRRCSYPPSRLATIFPLVSRRSFNSDRICRSAARSRAPLSYQYHVRSSYRI